MPRLHWRTPRAHMSSWTALRIATPRLRLLPPRESRPASLRARTATIRSPTTWNSTSRGIFWRTSLRISNAAAGSSPAITGPRHPSWPSSSSPFAFSTNESRFFKTRPGLRFEASLAIKRSHQHFSAVQGARSDYAHIIKSIAGAGRLLPGHRIALPSQDQAGSSPDFHLMLQPELGVCSSRGGPPLRTRSTAWRKSAPVAGAGLPGRVESNCPQ